MSGILRPNGNPLCQNKETYIMSYVAIIALIAGVAGAALTYLGMLNIMPLMYWGALAAIGGVLVIFTRRPGD
jgi:hypothetical protein